MPYLTTNVIGPDWIPAFQCLIEACPHTCCQQWNVEVDQEHGELFEKFDDPELRPLLDQILRKAKMRRCGQKNPETVYRFNLADQPDRRCPIMNSEGACRLHRRYGGEVLCHTCYFFPRLFWQINENYWMTLDLSCPEAARMAVCSESKPRLAVYEAEIDPAAEWMETGMALNPSVGELLAVRESLLNSSLEILQSSSGTLPERLRSLALALKMPVFSILPADEVSSTELFRLLNQILDWSSEGRERSFEAVHDLFFRFLAMEEDPMQVMGKAYRRVRDAVYLPFITEHPNFEENFLSHLLISDTFKQFDRYRNENISPDEVCRHEALYLAFSYALFRVAQVKRCMETGTINKAQFVETVWQSNNAFWHYPMWLERCLKRITDEVAAVRVFLSS